MSWCRVITRLFYFLGNACKHIRFRVIILVYVGNESDNSLHLDVRV